MLFDQISHLAAGGRDVGFTPITAIAQHDDLEREFEGDHLNPSGAPMDFTMRSRSDAVEIPRFEKLIEDALYRSRWVALLTAMHVCFLSQDKCGDSARLDRFCNDLRGQATQWRKELGIEEADVERSYAFLQWCDRLSLILIQDELPRDERRLEISTGPDGKGYTVVQRESDQTIRVEPWPFQSPSFTVQAEWRLLTRLSFSSDTALSKALRTAPVRTQQWELQAE